MVRFGRNGPRGNEFAELARIKRNRNVAILGDRCDHGAKLGVPRNGCDPRVTRMVNSL